MAGKKTILSVTAAVSVLCLLFAALPFTASAAEQTINATEVTLYALSDTDAAALSIPDEYPQAFTFAVEGESDVAVSSWYLDCSGATVRPRIDTRYWYTDGWIYTEPHEEKTLYRVTHDPRFGTFGATVTADGRSYYVTVNVVNYASVYTDRTVRDYLDANITDGMTTREKLEVIGRFIGDREYDWQYYTFEAMVVHGGGDCWASTEGIITMEKLLGMDEWERNGNRSATAGSNHKNAMVYDGETYYMVEAGYNMDVPRACTVTERTSLFSFRYNSTYGGYEAYQYDGKTMPAKLAVPDTFEGEPVVSVGKLFVSNTDVQEVVLPGTVKRIDSDSFKNCTSLTSLVIPSSVTEIADTAVDGVPSVTVYGSSGTAAETYANAKDNVTFYDLSAVLRGDVDGDGNVTIQDATQLQRYLAEMQQLDIPALAAADMNGDGRVNVRDVTALQRSRVTTPNPRN